MARSKSRRYIPKPARVSRTFAGSKDVAFQAKWEAEGWLHENGYSYGSTDGSPYVPIQQGEYTLPQKLYNFSDTDIQCLAGIIKSRDYRHGDVEIILY